MNGEKLTEAIKEELTKQISGIEVTEVCIEKSFRGGVNIFVSIEKNKKEKGSVWYFNPQEEENIILSRIISSTKEFYK